MEFQNMLYFGTLLLIGVLPWSKAGDVGFAGKCSSASDCDESKGLVVCKRAYDSCSKGSCQCASDKKYVATRIKCITDDAKALIGQACLTSTGITNAKCVNNKVTCNAGTSNVGNVLCRTDKTKLLGDSCNWYAGHRCFTYKADSHSNTGRCVRYVCGCGTGVVWVDTECRPRRMGDICIHSNECIASQRCLKGKCDCLSTQKALTTQDKTTCYLPTEYGSGAEGVRCASNKACAFGLECGRCAEHAYSTCRKIPLRSVTTYTAPVSHFTLAWVAIFQAILWLL